MNVSYEDLWQWEGDWGTRDWGLGDPICNKKGTGGSGTRVWRTLPWDPICNGKGMGTVDWDPGDPICNGKGTGEPGTGVWGPSYNCLVMGNTVCGPT